MCLLGGLSKIEDRINNEFNKGKKKRKLEGLVEAGHGGV
jgi:hypothetical protein